MTTWRHRFAAITFAFSCVAAYGQPAAASASPVGIPDIPYTKFVLKNGLTLLVHEHHKLPVVAVNTWHHVLNIRCSKRCAKPDLPAAPAAKVRSP